MQVYWDADFSFYMKSDFHIPIDVVSSAELKDHSLYELASRFIDREKTASDPFGDGDQSPVTADLPTDPGQRLRDFWCSGGNFFELVHTQQLPPIFQFSFLGSVNMVKNIVEKTTEAGSEARTQLLEGRASNLRVTPLMACRASAVPP